MTDIFEAPKKTGFGVGIEIIVTDNEGNRVSSETIAAYGFDNPAADTARTQIKEAIENLVEEWKQRKYGGPPA